MSGFFLLFHPIIFRLKCLEMDEKIQNYFAASRSNSSRKFNLIFKKKKKKDNKKVVF